MPVQHPAYLLLHMIDKYPHFFHRGTCQPQQRPLSRATIQGLTADLSTAQPLAKRSNVCLTLRGLHSLTLRALHPRHLVATQADLVPTSWRSLRGRLSEQRGAPGRPCAEAAALAGAEPPGSRCCPASGAACSRRRGATSHGAAAPAGWAATTQPNYLLTIFLLAGYSLPSTPTKQASGAPAVAHATCAQQGWLSDDEAGAWGSSSACQEPRGRQYMLSSAERWPRLCGVLHEEIAKTASSQRVIRRGVHRQVPFVGYLWVLQQISPVPNVRWSCVL